MSMVEVLTHPPFEIAHCKILVPTPSAVTDVVARVGFDTTPVPEMIDQVPIPALGEFAAKLVIGEDAHKVWLLPATDGIDNVYTCTTNVEMLVAHTPFETLHCRVFVPKFNPDTVLFDVAVFVITPLPVNTDQLPTPTDGTLAFKTVLGELIHSD
jgi:hypothetical protein